MAKPTAERCQIQCRSSTLMISGRRRLPLRLICQHPARPRFRPTWPRPASTSASTSERSASCRSRPTNSLSGRSSRGPIADPVSSGALDDARSAAYLRGVNRDAAHADADSLVETDCLAQHVDDPGIRILECTVYLQPADVPGGYREESERAKWPRATTRLCPFGEPA